MIIVSERHLIIPADERHIGFAGDNLAEKRVFCIKDKSLFNLDFRLDIKQTGETVFFEKVPSKDKSSLYLEWDITAGALKNEPTLEFQLRAFEAEGEKVWHSEKSYFSVSSSIDADREITEEQIGEFETIEKNMAKKCAETALLLEKATNLCNEAKVTVATAKAEIGADLTDIKSNVCEIQTDITVIRDDVTRAEESIENTQSESDRLNEELTYIKKDVSNTKQSISELKTQMGNVSTELDNIISLEEHYTGEQIL